MNTSFDRSVFIRFAVHFLIMVFLAKLLALVSLFFLPKEGVENSAKSDFVMPYMRYSIDDFRLKASENKQIERASSLSIDSIVLKAIYMMGKESFIVAAPKNNKAKSKTVAIGELFEGYVLKEVFSDYVIFERNYKTYQVYITKPKESSRWKSIAKETRPSAVIEEPVRRIASVEVKKVIANPTNIWKNIGLREHLIQGKASGFLVTFVRKGTIFESLGLKVGDVIKGVNNKELINNAQAFSAYQELKDAKAIKLTILRGNTTMELEYEVF